MDPSKKYNKFTLSIMEGLKNDPFFFKENSIIQYDLLKEQIADDFMRIGKVQAVWDLRDLGAIIIHDEERIGLDYEFQLLVVRSAFDGIYRRCIEEVKRQSLEEYEQKRKITEQTPLLKKLLKKVIQTRNLGKKQDALLVRLSNFKPVSIRDIKEKIKTQNLASLLRDTGKKLRGSGFAIKATKIPGVKRVDFYQLTYTAPIIES